MLLVIHGRDIKLRLPDTISAVILLIVIVSGDANNPGLIKVYIIILTYNHQQLMDLPWQLQNTAILILISTDEHTIFSLLIILD